MCASYHASVDDNGVTVSEAELELHTPVRRVLP